MRSAICGGIVQEGVAERGKVSGGGDGKSVHFGGRSAGRLRTYWLMRTMAMSSRSVRRLNSSSIACVGVSSVGGCGKRGEVYAVSKKAGSGVTAG